MKWLYARFLLSAAVVFPKPANDWNKPCFYGECAYDMPPSSGNSGVLRMTGAGITDITPAAGWVILDCDPHSLEQEIRLVCSSADHEEAGCSHVFENGGAPHKVVRLPESCSDAPFLRIADARISDDQSIPHHAVRRVSRQDGVAPTVHILRVDSNWAASDLSRAGPVNFLFVGTNSPDMDTPTSSPRRQLYRRESDGFFDWIKNAFNTVKDAVVHAANVVANAVSTTANNVVSSLKKLTSFSINPEHIKSVQLDTKGQDVLIYKLHKEHTPSCKAGVAVNLEISAGGKINATVKLGLTANGSVIPPQIGSFAVYAIVDGNVDAHIRVDATVIGHLSTDRIKVAEVSISPIQIPGVISLGPFIRLEAQADLDLLLEVLVDATLKYKVDQLEFWYPKKITEEDPEAKDGTKNVNLLDSPFKISATTDVAAEANLTAHLVPSLHLGVSAFSGLASASGYVEVDVWARLHLRGEIAAKASKTHRELDAPGLNVRSIDYVPPYLGLRGLDAVTAGFKGCVGAYAGVALRAGAQGSIGLVKGETPQWEIYKSPELEIFHQCWGTTSKRSITAVRATSLERRGGRPSLKCGSGYRKPLPPTKPKPLKLH